MANQEAFTQMIKSLPPQQAILLLDEQIETEGGMNDHLYYLRGNAYRKLGNWQQALNNYLKAVELNPDSPAAVARDMLNSIMDFYNKDMYNH